MIYQGYLTDANRLSVQNYLEQKYYQSSSGNFSYQWEWNGTNIDYATNSFLTLTNVQVTNDGSYTVIVSNPAGSVASSNAVLTVNAPPVILAQPRSLSVTMPASASFVVAASGAPPPSFQWLVNGVNVPADRRALTISNTVPSDGGAYTVIVSNSVGFVVSSNAGLLVNYLTETPEGTPQQIVSTNLTLPSAVQPGTAFAVSAVAPISLHGGQVQLGDGSITYTPPAGFVGMDSFAYLLAPDSGPVVQGAVTVLVDVSYIMGATVSGGQAAIQFAGVPGKTYIIQASTNLVNWTVIDVVPAGSNGLFQFQDGYVDQYPQRYYRALGE